jgi:hypothetical protein
MPNRNYKHLEPTINRYFSDKGMTVEIEPHGSQDADLLGVGHTVMVGEIKHSDELNRDLLSGWYWQSWNSNSQFGGKTPSYKLGSEFPDDVCNLKRDVLSWIAVIYGQLFYYAKRKFLTEGWLVFEDFMRFNHGLQEALSYLQKNYKIIFYQIEELDNVGFCKIHYQKGEVQMAKTEGGGSRGGGGGGSGGEGWIWLALAIFGAIVTAVGTVAQTGKAIKGDRKLKKKLKDLDEMFKKGKLSQEEYNKLRERLINESQTHEM